MQQNKTKIINSESHHWYYKDGRPCYELPYADKKRTDMKKTTLRDARKLGLVPSVTTVFSIKAKPGLEVWKQNMLLMAAMTLPKIKGESPDDYAVRVIEDYKKIAELAREEGTRLHGVLERFYIDGTLPVSEKDKKIVIAVNKKLIDLFGEQKWSAEKSFAHRWGYGGKVDLNSKMAVVDFKTTEFTASKPPRSWPDQVQQLAAYRNGLELPKAKCVNIYISTNEPGTVHAKVWGEEELEKALMCFGSWLNTWKNEKDFNPAF